MPGRAQIPAALLQNVIDAARDALPNEATGLLVADRSAAEGGVPSRFVRLINAAGSPYRFHADPAEKLREVVALESATEVVWGIVHAHLASDAVPSATDLRLAFVPDSLSVICSLAGDVPEVRAWSISYGEAREVPLSVR